MAEYATTGRGPPLAPASWRDWLWFLFAVLVCCAKLMIERVARSNLANGCLTTAGVCFAAAVKGETGVIWFFALGIPTWVWLTDSFLMPDRQTLNRQCGAIDQPPMQQPAELGYDAAPVQRADGKKAFTASPSAKKSSGFSRLIKGGG